MKKKMLFVFNKRSGKGLVRLNISDMIDIFSKAGYEIVIHSTQSRGDAAKTVLEYTQEVDVIACAGGDGTLNEVISGIINGGRDIPLFYIPSGSTNDFASSLNIPKNQLQATVSAMVGVPKYIDIGKLNDKYFCYVAAFGLWTDISYETDQNLKNRLGYAAYVLEMSKRLFKIPVFNMTATIDGKEYTDGWCYGMVTNSTQVAGVKNITGSDVLFDDGLFEVTLIRETRNPVEFIEAVNSVATGVKSRFVLREKASMIRMNFDNPVVWTIDGEKGGEYKDVVIENINKAVRISLTRDEQKNISDRHSGSMNGG